MRAPEQWHLVVTRASSSKRYSTSCLSNGSSGQMPSFVWAIRFWLIQTRPVAEFRWLGVCEYAMMPRRRIFWGIFRLLLRVTSPWWLAVACDQLRILRYCLLLNGTHTAQDTLWYVSVLRYRVSLDINTISGFLLPSIHSAAPFFTSVASFRRPKTEQSYSCIL